MSAGKASLYGDLATCETAADMATADLTAADLAAADGQSATPSEDNLELLPVETPRHRIGARAEARVWV